MGGGGSRRRESPGAAGKRASGPGAPTSFYLALQASLGHAAEPAGARLCRGVGYAFEGASKPPTDRGLAPAATGTGL